MVVYSSAKYYPCNIALRNHHGDFGCLRFAMVEMDMTVGFGFGDQLIEMSRRQV
jgi:hypothetical protein